MKILEDYIERNAKHLGNGVVKVDSFINHQVDSVLMQEIGEELANRFRTANPTKILTAEVSGIAPALSVGMSLKIPILFARKHQPITMTENPLHEPSGSPTHGKNVELIVSTEYLKESDRILIIDDFLASAQTIKALTNLVKQSKATLVGVGTVIEKAYLNGRLQLNEINVPVESLVVIEKCINDKIVVSRSK